MHIKKTYIKPFGVGRVGKPEYGVEMKRKVNFKKENFTQTYDYNDAIPQRV